MNTNVIKYSMGEKIVIINEIKFKGKRAVDWNDVRLYLRKYVGDAYTVIDTNDKIYQWFTYGMNTTEKQAADDLINDFRTAMINYS